MEIMRNFQLNKSSETGAGGGGHNRVKCLPSLFSVRLFISDEKLTTKKKVYVEHRKNLPDRYSVCQLNGSRK